MSNKQIGVLAIPVRPALGKFLLTMHNALGYDSPSPECLIDSIFHLSLAENVGNDKFDVFDTLIEDVVEFGSEMYSELFSLFEVAISETLPMMIKYGLLSIAGEAIVTCVKYESNHIMCIPLPDYQNVPITPDMIVKDQMRYITGM
jgi:hypothetical protein